MNIIAPCSPQRIFPHSTISHHNNPIRLEASLVLNLTKMLDPNGFQTSDWSDFTSIHMCVQFFSQTMLFLWVRPHPLPPSKQWLTESTPRVTKEQILSPTVSPKLRSKCLQYLPTLTPPHRPNAPPTDRHYIPSPTQFHVHVQSKRNTSSSQH